MLFLFAYTHMHRPSHTHTLSTLLSTLRMCMRAVKRCYRRLRGALFLQHFWEANDGVDADGQLAAGSPKWHHLSRLCSLSSYPSLTQLLRSHWSSVPKGNSPRGVGKLRSTHHAGKWGEKKGIGATLSVVCVFFSCFYYYFCCRVTVDCT